MSAPSRESRRISEPDIACPKLVRSDSSQFTRPTRFLPYNANPNSHPCASVSTQQTLPALSSLDLPSSGLSKPTRRSVTTRRISAAYVHSEERGPLGMGCRNVRATSVPEAPPAPAPEGLHPVVILENQSREICALRNLVEHQAHAISSLRVDIASMRATTAREFSSLRDIVTDSASPHTFQSASGMNGTQDYAIRHEVASMKNTMEVLKQEAVNKAAILDAIAGMKEQLDVLTRIVVHNLPLAGPSSDEEY